MEKAVLETKKMQFLYKDEHYNFMDIYTYEQIILDSEHIGENQKFLLENLEINMTFYKGNAISIDLPLSIEAEVIETEPGVKGDTVSSTFKPAKIATGASLQVPLFINVGDTVKIDTRTGEYITRISK